MEEDVLNSGIPWESCGEMPTFHQQQECADRAMDRGWAARYAQTSSDFESEIARTASYPEHGLGQVKETKIDFSSSPLAFIDLHPGLLTYPLIIGAVAYWATGNKKKAIWWGAGSMVVGVALMGGVGYWLYKKLGKEE
jgi:hypothetical protein